MRHLLAISLVCLAGVATVSVADARSRRKPVEASASGEVVGVQPQQGLEEILTLWREGRFEELYGRTTPSGRGTKESFIEKVSSATRRPASSWEKMQEVRVAVNGDDEATVHARLGFEGGMNGTEFSTRDYRLVREDGVWKMSQADIFALAGKTKKKRSRRLTSTR